MEPKCSFPCSEEPDTGLCFEPDTGLCFKPAESSSHRHALFVFMLSSHLYLRLQSGLFPSGFPN
jgi:hypothetical protein